MLNCKKKILKRLDVLEFIGSYLWYKTMKDSIKRSLLRNNFSGTTGGTLCLPRSNVFIVDFERLRISQYVRASSMKVARPLNNAENSWKGKKERKRRRLGEAKRVTERRIIKRRRRRSKTVAKAAGVSMNSPEEWVSR